MKKIFLSITASLLTLTSFAQWTEVGDNKTNGNLSIGNHQKNETKLSLNASENDYSNSFVTFDFSKNTSGIRSAKVGLANILSLFSTDVNGLKQDRIYIAKNGNVGIGTNLWYPKTLLDVDGDISMGNSTKDISTLTLITKEIEGGKSLINFEFGKYASGIRSARIGQTSTILALYTTNTVGEMQDRIYIANDGRVGIGTNQWYPRSELDVNGTIRSREIKVEIENWSDFVFDKDYKLPTLLEVEAHINEHNRLPDIPSEKQVKEEGINIGEMQAKLLQKIEELTLYVIDQNKKIEEQHQQIEALKSIISVK